MARAFLCHATEDKAIVERLARALMAAGIDTFFDQWEIRAGDSLRQRIDAGIEGCTDFVVVLSSVSIRKPWVNAELDAGFVRRLSDQLRLIPLRVGLSPEQLPPLLRGLRSPSLDAFDECVAELMSTIHGLVERPEMGSAPAIASPILPDHLGLSAVASHIAAFLVRQSTKGRWGDPQLSIDELRRVVGVPDDDIAEAVDELERRGWVHVRRALGAGQIGFVGLMPTPGLFVALDGALMSWNPVADAREVAAQIVNSEGKAMVVPLLDRQVGWGPRRMNPAIEYLVSEGVIDHSNSGDPDYQYYSLSANVRTRRFLQERSSRGAV